MSSVTTCTIRAHAAVAKRAGAVGALRDDPDPAGAPRLPPRFLRHADEHTVVGVRAVQRAIARGSTADGAAPGGKAFERFGVVAATCRAGRPASARTLVQFRDGGPVTVSPHIVPQCSLHAPASAVSVGLGMHGPNIGVGGGPEAIGEGMLAALSILAEPGVAGCWLVLTAWDAEPTLDESGAVPADAICRAVAMALDCTGSGSTRLSLCSAAARAAVRGDGEKRDGSRPLALLAASLGQALSRCGGDDESARCLWTLDLGWGATVTLDALPATLVRHTGRRAA